MNFFPNEWKTVKWQESSIAIVKSECKRKNAQINEMWYFQWRHPRPGRRVRSRLVNLHRGNRRYSRARRQTPLSQVSSIALKIVSHLLPQLSQDFYFSEFLEKKTFKSLIKRKNIRRLTLLMEIIWKKIKNSFSETAVKLIFKKLKPVFKTSKLRSPAFSLCVMKDSRFLNNSPLVDYIFGTIAF